VKTFAVPFPPPTENHPVGGTLSVHSRENPSVATGAPPQDPAKCGAAVKLKSGLYFWQGSPPFDLNPKRRNSKVSSSLTKPDKKLNHLRVLLTPLPPPQTSKKHHTITLSPRTQGIGFIPLPIVLRSHSHILNVLICTRRSLASSIALSATYSQCVSPGTWPSGFSPLLSWALATWLTLTTSTMSSVMLPLPRPRRPFRRRPRQASRSPHFR
jgi:hypothetical protein